MLVDRVLEMTGVSALKILYPVVALILTLPSPPDNAFVGVAMRSHTPFPRYLNPDGTGAASAFRQPNESTAE